MRVNEFVNEVKMSPSVFKQFGKSGAATQVLVGVEYELFFKDLLKNKNMLSPEAQEFYDGLPKIGEETDGGIFIGLNSGNLIVASPTRYETKLDWHKAKEYCRQLNIDGHSDWYLPSKEELNLLWENRDQIPQNEWNTPASYWSSTASCASFAYAQGFSYGDQGVFGKTNRYRVRAVRKIPVQ